LCQVFHEFWYKAGIGTISGNKPTVHCFRHTFAVKRLNLWVQEGKNLNACLPYLSMYMGHVHFSDTDYYLHLVPEFFSFMTAKIDKGYSHFIPEVNI